METRRALLVDAFTADPLAGNAAGVVPDADGLTESQMGAIARELGASETAFLLPSHSADRRIRYFTPTQEVDLCGHATVAAHAHLRADGRIEAGAHTLETAVGDLAVEVTTEGVVWMTQAQPTVTEVDLDLARTAEALGVDRTALADAAAELPPAVASTGLPFLVVPVTFLEHLGAADPDLDAVAGLAADHDAAGVYAFTFDALSADSTLHARTFAPGVGVPEDPATGTASGACGAYLRHVGAFEDEGGTARGPGGPDAGRRATTGMPEELRFEQGHFVDRPSVVRVRVGETVRVGGRAATALDGSIAVPTDGDDEIIEVP
ncbi:PhzF family phenazine biosynthesis protein [Halegenticoccus tardaugens]|uniref:PhzF family phenazine biosynthesis protein n=1 Tax=Halegenticoccus tardaugens TaxID=2071624 RepID=UPI00100ADC3D|nr:PhzF family phenazine biosynthesis protein [Halegenticoccus tardaugens]